MKKYRQISKGDLKKYIGCKCRFENRHGIQMDGTIYQDKYGDICVGDITLYRADEEDTAIDNINYKRIEIGSNDLSEMAQSLSSLGDYTNEITVDVTEVDPNRSKKYVVYVSGMSAPRKIHETLIEAQNEAKRLCGIEAKDVYVAELVDKYGIEIVKKDF